MMNLTNFNKSLNITNTNSSFDCVVLNLRNGNLTFCGVTKSWQPKLSEVNAIASVTAVSVVAFVVLLYSIYKFNVIDELKGRYKKKKETYKNKCKYCKCDHGCDCLHECTKKKKSCCTKSIMKNTKCVCKCDRGCDCLHECTKKKESCCTESIRKFKQIKGMVTEVFLPAFGLIWNMIDSILDAYTFYKMERDDLIDSTIYRNRIVNDSIIVFALSGAMRNYYLVRLWQTFDQFDDCEYLYKIMVFLLTFSIQMPELILQYFYIERYVMTTPTYFLMTKDLILAVIAIYSAVKLAFDGKNAICVVVGMVSIAQCLRIIGHMHQYLVGSLVKACFEVENGKLFQTPFHKDCMTGIDYAIFISLFTPHASYILLCIFGCCAGCGSAICCCFDCCDDVNILDGCMNVFQCCQCFVCNVNAEELLESTNKMVDKQLENDGDNILQMRVYQQDQQLMEGLKNLETIITHLAQAEENENEEAHQEEI